MLEVGIEKSEIKSIEDKVILQVEQATEIAKSSPAPSFDLIFKDLWSNGGSKWHN
jgi:pyruvate dehydrogenase E1 component alpha subunit